MAKDKVPEISTGDALNALEQHIQIRSMWMLKAQTLLQLIGAGVGNPESLAANAKALAESMPE